MSELSIDILVQGFPGYSPSNGGMGWSTIGMVRSADRTILIDTGPFGVRELLRGRLREYGLAPAAVTDVVLTHAHHDHSVNWPMFPQARVHIARAELEWALAVAPGSSPVPEFSVREIARHPGLSLVSDIGEIVPGVRTEVVAGHTPGSLIVHIDQGESTVTFLGDAAKNRAELLSGGPPGRDRETSARSVATIWDRWRAHPQNTVIPGHDLPMKLIDAVPTYIASREAAVVAYLGRRNDDTVRFDLSGR